MIIEKIYSPGYYKASGLGILGIGRSHSEALDDWFNYYYFLHNFEVAKVDKITKIKTWLKNLI